MRFDVITLFAELFEPFTKAGVTRRAFESGAVDLRLWPLRDHASGAYRRVDDRPYGGGPGMVMLVEPLERALAAVRASRAAAGAPAAPVILFTPTGAPLTQRRVEALAAGPGAILVCGRYEGIDQRFIDRRVDEELSLGDFVLSGGELPALALLDAVARLQPGVLNDAESAVQDSFSDGLLDCPHYSRPEVLQEPETPDASAGADPAIASSAVPAGPKPADPAVPGVLLSGHHDEIRRWRRERQLTLTAQRRPDLIAAARAAGRLSPQDEETLRRLGL
jgi:tRNA (guanine37-N1)-methyltransferase